MGAAVFGDVVLPGPVVGKHLPMVRSVDYRGLTARLPPSPCPNVMRKAAMGDHTAAFPPLTEEAIHTGIAWQQSASGEWRGVRLVLLLVLSKNPGGHSKARRRAASEVGWCKTKMSNDGGPGAMMLQYEGGGSCRRKEW